MTNKIKASNLDTNAVTADAISYPLTTFSSTGIDDNASSTTITIDSSGNVSVGTTEAPATVATTSSSSVEGLGYQANDYLAISRAGTSEQANLILNKLTNDGDIIVLNKNGTRVGSIDVSSTGMGLYLGGTGSANHLDDYEEGTFTTTLIPSSSGSVSLTYDELAYRKIGNVVYITGEIRVSSVSSPSGSFQITNLPFAVGDFSELSERTAGIGYRYGIGTGSSPLVLKANAGVTALSVQEIVSGNAVTVNASDLQAGSEIVVQMFYFTN